MVYIHAHRPVDSNSREDYCLKVRDFRIDLVSVYKKNYGLVNGDFPLQSRGVLEPGWKTKLDQISTGKKSSTNS